MKTIKLVLTALALMLTSFSWSQVFLNLEEIAQTDSNEYTLVLTADNLPSGSVITRIYYGPFFDLDSTIEITVGDTLYNFDRVHQWINVYYDSKLIATASKEKSDVAVNQVLNSYTLPTTRASRNGTMTVTFDRDVPQSSFSVWNFHNGYEYPTSTTDQRTYVVSEMEMGMYFFDIYVDEIDPEVHFIQFGSFLGDPAERPNGNLYLNFVYPLNLQSFNDSCNASAAFDESTAVGNVTYEWDTQFGFPDTNAVDNLCPGRYTFLAEDEAGNSYIGGCFIEGVSTEVLTFQADAGPATDTVFSYSWDCNFDYNAPIDSVHTQITGFYSEDIYEYLYLNYIVFQGGDSLIVPLYTIRDTTIENFKYIHHTFRCVTEPDVHYVSRSASTILYDMPPLTRSIGSMEDVMVIYPNPVQDVFMIKGSVTAGDVVDLFGNKVLHFTGGTVDVSALPKGMYMVQLEGQSTCHRIVKQ